MVEEDAARWGEGGVAVSGDAIVEGCVCPPEAEPELCGPMVVMRDAADRDN